MPEASANVVSKVTCFASLLCTYCGIAMKLLQAHSKSM